MTSIAAGVTRSIPRSPSVMGPEHDAADTLSIVVGAATEAELALAAQEDDSQTTVAAVRDRKISWTEQLENGIINGQEVDVMIELCNEESIQARSEIVKSGTTLPGSSSSSSSSSNKYLNAMLRVLYKANAVDVLQSVLLVLNDALDFSTEVAAALAKPVPTGPTAANSIDALVPLARLRGHSDAFISEQAASAAAKILLVAEFPPVPQDAADALMLIAHPGSQRAKERDDLVNWACVQLRKPLTREIAPAVSALSVLVRRPEMRQTVYKLKGHRLLPAVLRTQTSHPQTMYQAALALWLLSFVPAVCKDLAADTHAIAVLHDVLRRVRREKVLRVALFALSNLLNLAPDRAVKEMVSVGLFQTLRTLLKRKFGDADIPDCAQKIADSLDKQITELSSFDMYYQEVMSGKLEWSPVHKNEVFWRENLAKFEEKDCAILKELISLVQIGASQVDGLASPTGVAAVPAMGASVGSGGVANGGAASDSLVDMTTLAVACFDLGEFVRLHPRGRKILRDLNAKTKIMQLMSHPNEEVRKQALLCTQKMLVQKWEFLA